MMDIIVCAGSNLFRMYVTYRFIRIFLEETKLSRVKEVTCYLLFWIVNTTLFLRFHLAWVNVICNLIGISLLIRMYTKMWKENIFVTFSIYAVGMACDVFVTLLFVPYKDGNMYNQAYGARMWKSMRRRNITLHLFVPLCRQSWNWGLRESTRAFLQL